METTVVRASPGAQLTSSCKVAFRRGLDLMHVDSESRHVPWQQMINSQTLMLLPTYHSVAMPERASVPVDVVLPSFQETFSEVIRRYPVEPQQRMLHSATTVPSSGGSYFPPDHHEVDPSRVVPSPRFSSHGNVSQPLQREHSQQTHDGYRRPGIDTYSQGQTPLTSRQATMDSSLRYYQSSRNQSTTPSISASPDRTFPRDQDIAEGVRMRRRHVCSVCDKDFLRPSSLETHMNSHTGAKPHKCTFPGCDKCFSAKSNMKRHLRKHYAPDDANQDGNSDDLNDDEL